MLPSMRRVPFRTRIGAVTTGATGTSVGQGAPKPISKLVLAGTQIDERKATCILVLTDELARFSDSVAGNLFATELSAAVAAETDANFVSVLTSGATSFASNGATAEHVLTDLRGLLAAITTSARSQLFLLMTSAIAKILSVVHTNTGAPAFPTMGYGGGSIGGIQAVVSDGVPSGTMLLVDAQQVAAASETIQLSATNEAAVQLNDTPDSPPTGATLLVSLWQHNLVGLKAERIFGCQKLTSSGVCVLTGIAYVGDSPGP
jgi:HK97 family phage major capsid protein